MAHPGFHDSANRIRLMHVITATGIGGAQTMLERLVGAGDDVFGGYEQSILSLMSAGTLGLRLARAGVPVHTLGMRGGVPTPAALFRLVGLSRAVAPDLFVGWMHHAGLAAWYAARMHWPRRPVIWNVRHSLHDIAYEKPATRAVLRHSARLSRHIDAIIFNSHVARTQYGALGYDLDRATVIPNGFDGDHFRPRPDARARLLSLFPVDGTRPIIGMVARNHPMKDPGLLIDAVRRLASDRMDADLLIVGPGMEHLPDQHHAAGSTGSAADRITLSGQRHDIGEWLAGLDLLVLPSAWGEAFPNIIGEAMASGVPCIATDVGDARWIIGDCGRAVPPRDVAAMQAAIAGLLSLPPDARRNLGRAGRERVLRMFSLATVAQRYAALYAAVLQRWRLRQGAGAPAGVAGAT
ncbi:glycosyltransferase [Sphingomonas sp. KC8]|uniref:glycosyltransferase n=1 Tax=Sphingomonas sp. KC8 TaxID=1030157 RepID=UPI00067FBBD4|nr:glycosyltransferase [Sphingomonas sp. KC8]ARS27230.1 hypothetical protein KC8_07990 [Sphingomonas sp. KC8]